MNGIDLKELDASDMLDVIHYFFEEDLNYSSKEQMDSVEAIRKIVYEEFYLTKFFLDKNTYTYPDIDSSKKIKNNSFKDITPFDPNSKKSSKGYMPPTKFDSESSKPFGDLLDGPSN